MTPAIIAKELLAARARARQVPLYSEAVADFDTAMAYDVSAEILKLRMAAGETPVGRKIGFTNTNIWAEYGVDAPIWNYVFDTTIRHAPDNHGVQSLKGATQPKIEPEIALRLRAAPRPGMSEQELADCIDWIAHSYEVVHSAFRDWRFRGADTVAAFGLHGVLIVGQPRHVRAAGGMTRDLVKELKAFKVSLFCDGELREEGAGTNVLGSPLLALKHLVEVLAKQPRHKPLRAGEIITTGTLTAALPIRPGETWHTAFTGIDLPGLSVRFV
jgi:2-oxo-3-hexenedioate decarboxylase